LLNGIGEPHGIDPIELLPETLVIQRGAGIRREGTNAPKGEQRASVERGDYTDKILEFVLAIDKFKRINNMPFPTLTQIYDIILALGYHQTKPPRIAPLGYTVAKQLLAEKQKSVHEDHLNVYSAQN